MTFYCHQCRRSVNVDEHFECPYCHSGFVEEIPNGGQHNDSQESGRDDSAEEGSMMGGGHSIFFAPRASNEDPQQMLNIFAGPVSPIGGILQSFFQMASGGAEPESRQTPSSSGPRLASSSSNRGGPGQDGFTPFFNQLLSNLVAGEAGGHITLTFGGGGGDGEGPFQRVHGNMGDYAWGDGGLDQVVTLLLNQFDQSAQHEALRPEDIERLPMTTVTSEQVENGSQCTTCMEVFNENEEVAKLNCSHIFHRACIEPWLKRRNTCPICRKAVDPKEWGGPSSKPSKPNTIDIIDVDELD